MLAKEARKFQSTIIIKKDGKSVEAVKLMALMGMGVKCGQEISVEITGDDEDFAYEKIKRFFEENL